MTHINESMFVCPGQLAKTQHLMRFRELPPILPHSDRYRSAATRRGHGCGPSKDGTNSQ
jgi:hypothetical protein